MNDEKTVRQRLKSGEVLFGPWCVIPSAEAMDIVASAGFDFVIIDREHGTASIETVGGMIRAAQSRGVGALVRLGRINEEHILSALDLEADGVLTAHVESREQAREVVSLCKYAPAGQRGFSPYTRAGRYGGGDITAHAESQNERTLVGVILEGRQALQEIDAILETPHLDLVYLGAYDLSQSLGIPGEVDNPEIRKHLEVCVRKARDAGLAAGGFVARSADDVAWMVDIGMQFVTCLPDCAMLHRAMRQTVEDFRRLTR
jgi:4-hydroxy-2-oxoheptanedioate aldolase